MKAAVLWAPAGYWKLTPEQKDRMCGGCGPGKGIGGWLVPDSLWGLDITEACNCHDYMYQIGETIEDKQQADRVFLNNMLRLIDGEDSFFILRHIRTSAAMKYYNAVRDFGGPAFWNGKNDPENLGTANS